MRSFVVFIGGYAVLIFASMSWGLALSPPYSAIMAAATFITGTFVLISISSDYEDGRISSIADVKRSIFEAGGLFLSWAGGLLCILLASSAFILLHELVT